MQIAFSLKRLLERRAGIGSEKWIIAMMNTEDLLLLKKRVERSIVRSLAPQNLREKKTCEQFRLSTSCLRGCVDGWRVPLLARAKALPIATRRVCRNFGKACFLLPQALAQSDVRRAQTSLKTKPIWRAKFCTAFSFSRPWFSPMNSFLIITKPCSDDRSGHITHFEFNVSTKLRLTYLSPMGRTTSCIDIAVVSAVVKWDAGMHFRGVRCA